MQNRTADFLHKRLKHLRENRGLTQEQFAEKAGLTYKYYQAIETGRKRNLRLSTLDKLANGHAMPTWRLLSDEQVAKPRSEPRQGKAQSKRHRSSSR